MEWIFGIVAVICLTVIVIAALDSYDKRNNRKDDE